MSSRDKPMALLPGDLPFCPFRTCGGNGDIGQPDPMHVPVFIIMTHSFICLSVKVAPICQNLDGLLISSAAFTDSFCLCEPTPDHLQYAEPNAKYRVCIYSIYPSSPREESFLHLTSEEARLREGTRPTQGHTAGKQMRKTQV